MVSRANRESRHGCLGRGRRYHGEAAPDNECRAREAAQPRSRFPARGNRTIPEKVRRCLRRMGSRTALRERLERAWAAETICLGTCRLPAHTKMHKSLAVSRKVVGCQAHDQTAQ